MELVQPPAVASVLRSFHLGGAEDVLKYVRGLKKTHCQLDPVDMSKIPTA